MLSKLPKYDTHINYTIPPHFLQAFYFMDVNFTLSFEID